MRAHFRQPGFNPSPEGTKIDGPPPTPNQKIMLTRGVFGGLGYHWAALGQGLSYLVFVIHMCGQVAAYLHVYG